MRKWWELNVGELILGMYEQVCRLVGLKDLSELLMQSKEERKPSRKNLRFSFNLAISPTLLLYKFASLLTLSIQSIFSITWQKGKHRINTIHQVCFYALFKKIGIQARVPSTDT
jgi:hypothetical protein